MCQQSTQWRRGGGQGGEQDELIWKVELTAATVERAREAGREEEEGRHFLCSLPAES